jgi:putative Mn2+ efflux pump MntP
VGLTLVAVALAFAGVGLAGNIAGFFDPETWFLTGLVFAVLSLAVATDEQRLNNLTVLHASEEWLARLIMVLAFACALAGFVLGLLDADTRDLWSVMSVILALIALGVSMDAHRVAVARGSQIETHDRDDALAGVICAAVGFGLGVFGLFTGIFGLAHAEAWLFAGVVFAVVSAAFLFDEQAHVVHRARRERPAHICTRVPPPPARASVE